MRPPARRQLDTPTPASRSPRAKGAASYFETATQLEARYPELTAALEAIGHETFAFLPVELRVTAHSASRSLSWRGRAELDDDAWSFLQALTTQCGLALDRAERYESERSVAETLQRSVLPRSIPVLEGVRVAARYLPSSSALGLGGDWYEWVRPEGLVGLVVGDVVGKGVARGGDDGPAPERDAGADARRIRSRPHDDQAQPAAGRRSPTRPFATVAYLDARPEDARPRRSSRPGTCRPS